MNGNEWGTGLTRIRENHFDVIERRARRGGIGAVLRGRKPFCLKIVSLQERAGKINTGFWHEAKSASAYISVARNISGCAACPIPPHYWIHEEDPLYKKFPWQATSRERPKCLTDFISVFDITEEQLCQLDGHLQPEKYWLVPEVLLEDIYRSYELGRKSKDLLPPELHKEIFPNNNAALLLTYPILSGRSPLCVRTKYSSEEMLKMIHQILFAILELHRNGLAHGDIKPDNIMRSSAVIDFEQRFWFLSDVGSMQIEGEKPQTGTEGFFQRGAWRSLEKKWGGDNLLCRTLMDCYALARTIWSCAYGVLPTLENLNPRVVFKRWNDPLISEVYTSLYNVVELTLERLTELEAKLRSSYSWAEPKNLSIVTYGKEAEFKLDVKYRDRKKTTEKKEVVVEYGTLHEQLKLSRKSNPVLRFVGDCRCVLDKCDMEPFVKTYNNGGRQTSAMYYAPDDAKTGERPDSFDDYEPYSLATVDPPQDEDLAALLKIGADMGRERLRHKGPSFPLPYPQDIVKVDRKWRIQPFFLGNFRSLSPFDYCEYFKFLCGQTNGLSAQNIIDLLLYDQGIGVLFGKMNDEMVKKAVDFLETLPWSGREMEIMGYPRAYAELKEKLRGTEKFGKFFSPAAE